MIWSSRQTYCMIFTLLAVDAAMDLQGRNVLTEYRTCNAAARPPSTASAQMFKRGLLLGYSLQRNSRSVHPKAHRPRTALSIGGKLRSLLINKPRTDYSSNLIENRSAGDSIGGSPTSQSGLRISPPSLFPLRGTPALIKLADEER